MGHEIRRFTHGVNGNAKVSLKISLRRQQIESAKVGNVSMLILLG